MRVSRRDFLKWCTASAAAIGLNHRKLKALENVLSAGGKPPVLWLQGAGCSGCSISLLNSVRQATIDDLLINTIDLKYHHNLMTAAGSFATSIYDEVATQNNGEFILVIEGGVPTGMNGNYCVIGEKNGQPWTMQQAVLELGISAKYVLCVGTCSSFGGAPKAGPNPTGITRVDDNALLGRTAGNKIINLPGCPIHPYTFAQTLVELLVSGKPRLDREKRPTFLYKEKIHDNCPRRGTGNSPILGQQTGCLRNLGCQGPSTVNDCPNRKWNNQVNWCLDAGHTCIGCASPDFPTTPLYKFT